MAILTLLKILLYLFVTMSVHRFVMIESVNLLILRFLNVVPCCMLIRIWFIMLLYNLLKLLTMQNSKSLSKQEKFDQYSETFFNWCEFMDSRVAAFIAAQSALETGWFSSDVYIHNHNLFGMRLPNSRITLAKGINFYHAYYHDEFDSYVDYLLWLTAFGFNMADLKDLDTFVVKLRKSSFNPSDKYVDTILEIFNKYYLWSCNL